MLYCYRSPLFIKPGKKAAKFAVQVCEREKSFAVAEVQKITANVSQTCEFAVADHLLLFCDCGIEFKFAVPSTVLKALFRNETSAMFQNKKLKRNAIAEVAEVALCAFNCALPTSANNLLYCIIQHVNLERNWSDGYEQYDVTCATERDGIQRPQCMRFIDSSRKGFALMRVLVLHRMVLFQLINQFSQRHMK